MCKRQKHPTLLTAAGLLCVAACAEPARETLSPLAIPNSPSGNFVSMSSCGASFRAISNETDSLMAAYGIGTTVDTMDVCEMWGGSDYQFQAVAIGSSENLPGFTDTVQTVTYQSGYAAGYTQTGADASGPTSVGATAFDLVRADDETRQASYDDPYYGVSSHDPSTCLQPPCAAMTVTTNIQTSDAGKSSAPAQASLYIASDTLFSKYGIVRKGVRALVNDSQELPPSMRGYRRFKSVNGDRTIVRSVDPLTQLLMEEEITLPDEIMRITHTWVKVAGGYIKTRSAYVSAQKISGRTVTSFGSIDFQNVRISDPAYAPLSLATREN